MGAHEDPGDTDLETGVFMWVGMLTLARHGSAAFDDALEGFGRGGERDRMLGGAVPLGRRARSWSRGPNC